MSLNKIITYLIYIIKTLETALLKMVNSFGGTTYANWDDLMNSQTTVPETTAEETTVPETTAAG